MRNGATSQLATLPTDGAPVSNTQCQMDTDSDFFVRQVWPYIPGIPSGIHPAGNVVFRLRRGDGYAMSSNFIPVNSIRGALFKELKVKASDSLYFDAYLTDLTGAVGRGPRVHGSGSAKLGLQCLPLVRGEYWRREFNESGFHVRRKPLSGASVLLERGNQRLQVDQRGNHLGSVAVGTGPTGLTE